MLSINLKGKKAFVAGIGDDQGFGWAIAKALAEAGAEIIIGTWTPLLNIFQTAYRTGKFDESRKMSDGSLFNIEHVYPLDAMFDTMEDVPEEIRENKRYKDVPGYTISEVADRIAKEHGKIDILIHSLANAPEVKSPLLKTSRKGYLASMSSSSYSLISLLRHFAPMMGDSGCALTLSYLAAERTVPGYGGGMSSAKAALESDVRTLAFEAGQEYGIRVNAISAGPWRSRAARAIGIIERAMEYCEANAPLRKGLTPDEVATAAAFLCSPLASAITGETLYVDNGYHTMGSAIPRE